MTTTLRDALVDAAGPVTVVPPEHEIERRSRRLRRNSWLLEAGAVVAVAMVLLAVVVLPDDDAPTVRTIGPAQQEEEAATIDTEEEGGTTRSTTTTETVRAVPGQTPVSDPAVKVPLLDPGAPPPGYAGPPPPGARLAFTYGTKIETMRPDGTDRRLLFDDGTFYTLAGWSPKHDRLAVIHVDGDSRVLAVLDVTTGTSKTVVDRANADVYAADWSPDGKWIVYSSRTQGQSTQSDAYHHLRLVRPDGTDDHEIPVHACRPVWAPDSRRIAAVSCGGSGDDADMVIVDADGTDPIRLSGLRMQHVTWSPDGQWIAGSRFQESSSARLAVFHPDGSDVRTLPSGSSAWHRPAWTTDSKRLIYGSSPPQAVTGGACGTPTSEPCDHRKAGLYSIAIDGSDEVELTSTSESQPVMPWR